MGASPMKEILGTRFLGDGVFVIKWAPRDRFANPGLYIDVWGKERRLIPIPASKSVSADM